MGTVRPITAIELACCNLESLIAGPADDSVKPFPFESPVVFECDAEDFGCATISLDCVAAGFTCDGTAFGGDTADLSCGGVDFREDAADFSGDATDFGGAGTIVATLAEVVLVGTTVDSESEGVLNSIRDCSEGELTVADTDWPWPALADWTCASKARTSPRSVNIGLSDFVDGGDLLNDRDLAPPAVVDTPFKCFVWEAAAVESS